MKLMKKNGGFTLVELIVVIAILAILAGIAVPAYSGYIKRAEKAGDLQLLGAINEAFAASCVASGGSIADVSSATLAWENKCVTGVAAVSGTGIDADECKENFLMLFAGNTTTAFKQLQGVYFDPAQHVFVEGVSFTYTMADGTKVNLAVRKEQIDQVNGSIFANEEAGLGVDPLLNQMGAVTDFAGAVIGGDGAIAQVAGDLDFLRSFGGYLGIKGTDKMDAAQVQQAILQKYTDEEGNPTITEEQQNDMMANALVLYAAQNSTMDKTAVTEMLKGDAKTHILETMETDKGQAMAEAAVAYGMFTAYAHSLPDDYKDEEGRTKADMIAIATNKDNPVGVLHRLNDAGFKAYVEGAGQSDIDGYLAAMGMINESSSDNKVANDIITNGFDDNDMLSELLKGALG